jgi:predicted exporter
MMRARLELGRWHRWITAHMWAMLAVSALVLFAGASLYRYASTEEDIGALLPSGPGSPRESVRVLGEFGVLNTLLLDLEIPGATQDELVEAGERLAEELRRSGDFAEVHAGPSTHDLIVLGQVILPRRLYLLIDPAAEIRRRLESARLATSLDALKTRLASPQALAMKRELLRDPLNLNSDLLASFARMAGEIRPYRGQLLSKDGRHLLLVTTPNRPALDTEYSAALLERLRRKAAELAPGPKGHAVLRCVGGPRFATESAAGLRRDVLITLLTSVLALMALFIARFRGLRLLVLASIPLGFGMVGGLVAVVLIQGHIHALSLAFGAVLIGVGIDYPLYLLNSASMQSGEGLDRMDRALNDTWRPLWFGFTTTALGFCVLMLSKFPGLRELGLFAGAGIAISFAATLVLLVPLSAKWGPQRWQKIPSWMPKLKLRVVAPTVAWGVALAIVIGAAALIPSLRFDGELRNLDAERPEIMAEYQRVMDRFGVSGSDSLVIARARSQEEALAVNDEVTELLSSMEHRGFASGIRSIGSFLPAIATQQRRARSLNALDLEQARAELFAPTAIKAGFSPAAFGQFWEEVELFRQGKVEPLKAADFEQTALKSVLNRFLRCSADGCIAVTSFVPKGPEAVELISRSLPSGAVLLDSGAVAAETLAQLPRQLAILSGVGLLVNIIILAGAYRSLRLAIIACLPCFLGLLATLAILAVAHVPLNVVSASALVLVLGCGVDYGIFALQEVAGPGPNTAVGSTGVLLASLSTLAGFGTLVLASYRALQSLGTAVGIGVAASAAASIFLLPGLYEGLLPRKESASEGAEQ